MKNVLLKWKDSKFLFNNLKKIEGLKIIGVTDKVTEKELDESIKAAGINEICDTLHAANLYLNGECDVIIVSAKLTIRTLEDIASEFIDYGVKESDIVIATDEFFEEPEEKWLISWDKYYRLSYLEYHVADHCNLNCSSCVHFSPLVKEATFTDIDKLECDLMQLKKKVHYFDEIHILGGEPLLNDRLGDFIVMTRKIYPYCNLSLVTNGIALKTISNELIDIINECKVHVNVSLYPVMLNTMEGILKGLKERGLKNLSFSSPIKNFAIPFDENGGHLQFVNRINCTCPNLYNGKLYLCPLCAYLKYFNEYFHKSLSDEGGYIDIYDESITFKELKEMLHKPFKLCDNCFYVSKEQQILREWKSNSKPEITDYMYSERN